MTLNALSSQLVGATGSNPAEVELNTLAARFVNRPQDFTIYGSYSASFNNASLGNGAASITATNLLFGQLLMPQDSGMMALPTKITYSFQQIAAAGISSVMSFQVFKSNQVDGAPLAGPSNTSLTRATPAKLRGATRESDLSFYQFVNSATPADATVFGTQDSQPISNVTFPFTSAAQQIQTGTLLDIRTGEYPIVLTAGTAVNITITCPTAFSSTFAGEVGSFIQWTEIAPNW